ncbi:MAG: discoidin domain-containing protein [Prevotella sp.]|nr:discoidin domain-containing protein [Prevotella sp.]
MKKTLFSLLMWATIGVAAAFAQDNEVLEGFEYGTATAPDGTEWQSPGRLGFNKLQPRACFTSFASAEEARHVLPEYSSRRQSLDGTWKFHFAKTPDARPADFYLPDYDCSSWDDIKVPSCWNIVGLQKDGSQKYGTPIYVNQPVIFYHQVRKDDWREGVMRTPPTNWTTYEYRNEVGSYRRTFTIPKTWKNQELFVEFDGVDSFFYLWINGHYVGFSKNSRDAARFDISRYAKIGENTICVEVYRSSDGSFLEAQDMFRLPGIFRSVSVYATPKIHIGDLQVYAHCNNEQTRLNINTWVENLTGRQSKYSLEYKLYENELFSDNNRLITSFTEEQMPTATSQLKLKPWTAEQPNIYVLVAELKDKKGRTLEAVSTQIGFRTVEIRETTASQDEFGLAGRYFYVNGKPLKLKGVNRHETNPGVGHAITREQMEEEVMMMKRANINHVRTSHYSNDPYFYYLCNKYGIYLEAEANLESHEYYYGEASLSHPIEWRPAHIARMMELAHARINDPCIVIWSLGNEAGPGDNFIASYKALKAFDKTRPVQYERNNDIVDMGSNQYPSVNWVRQAVQGKMGIKYPFHISEYAHSMGNAVGNLQDYWDAIESTNFFCGGAIWDWIDQSMYNYTSDGHRYLAYGGDFGDTPNDGQFVMNGIIFGDLEPKPQYYEVKKVYQNIGITWDDVCSASVDIFNKNYYTDDLSDYDCYYRLIEDGKMVKEGRLDVGKVAPRTHKTVIIPDLKPEEFNGDREYFVNIEFRLRSGKPWAKAGYVQADEQLIVRAATNPVALNTEGTVEVEADNVLKGNGFRVQFDPSDGSICSLTYGGRKVFEDGCGPRLDAFRAWVNNDNWIYQNWYANGLHNLKHKATSQQMVKNADGSVSVVFTIESQAPCGARLEGADRNWKRLTEQTDKPFGADDFKFTQNLAYTVYPNGFIQVEAAINSNNPQLVLPRLGYVMKTPSSMDNFCYYGRGPIDNYPDRKTAQHIGIYENKVAAEFENFPKPQDMANHQDTRWCTLTAAGGEGVLFIGRNPMSVSVLPWTAQELAMANHPHELPKTSGNWLHLDMAITGLGGNSCGQGGPLENDRVKAGPQLFGFMICPANAVKGSKSIAFNGTVPLQIVRDAEGNVSISSAKKERGVYQDIWYKVIPANATARQLKAVKAKQYTGSFPMREGGTVVAYVAPQKSNSKDKVTPVEFSQEFQKIERVPVTVSFASSVESGEGDAEHLVDGNPNTFWHTMWSVTVANYPHWVDFDCGTVKTLKGFTYLPRQDSRNGNIRQYRIQVSTDGKTWGDAVCEGQFENDQKLKRVLFSAPVKARFLRFTALSSQDGQDFATGAEFSILEE